MSVNCVQFATSVFSKFSKFTIIGAKNEKAYRYIFERVLPSSF
jgi:hypothetical protein